MTKLRLRNLSFSYRLRGGSVPVLENVEAEFEEGQISAIVGKSGCGKTSLLRLIAGLSAPSRGAVRDRWRSPCRVFREKNFHHFSRTMAFFPGRTSGGMPN